MVFSIFLLGSALYYGDTIAPIFVGKINNKIEGRRIKNKIEERKIKWCDK